MKRLLLSLLLVLLACGCDSGSHEPPKSAHNSTLTQAVQSTPQSVPSARLPKFAELQPEVQAVVVSLEYHLGPKGAAKYVRHIAKGDLPTAIALLEAEKGVFANRRKAEAKLLRNALERGSQ